MADLLITPDVQASQSANLAQRFVRTTDDIAYFFALDATDRIAMWKTVNRGMAWVQTIVDGPTAARPAIWYDRWTPGLAGTLAYLMYYDQGDTVYRTFDPSTDTFGGINILYNGVHPADVPRVVGITRARGGNIYSAAESNSAGLLDRFWRGTTNRATPWEGPDDHILLLPGNEADPQDIYAPYWDRSANQIKLKHYDDSGNAWASVLIAAGMNDSSVRTWGATTRHSDNASFLIAWTAVGNPAANLRCWRIDDATTITGLTNVVTAVGGVYGAIAADLMMDQQTGRLYAFYARGDANNLVDVYYKMSPDGGVTWGPETQYNTTQDQWWLINAAVSADALGGGAAPAILDENGDDWYTNRDNGLFFGAAPVFPPVPPPDIVPPGGSYEPSPGAPPGTVVAITPDGEEFELMSPGTGGLSGSGAAFTGRYMMSFSGFGLAPIQYVSQRGPNQDGETVRDFHLTPRVVQLLERAQFRSRGEWWDGRADILNDLRPNRQFVATDTVPTILRIVTSNGDIRDLHVFIQEGPLFEPRNVDEWDEWAWQEVLRFIAHDPLWFDPVQVSLSLAIGLSTELVFPITFPIEFGGGAIDVTSNLDYVGTWATLPTIVIVGPLDGPIIENQTTGEKIQLLRAIGPDRTVTIDLAFGQKTITDDLGNNLLGSLSTDSDLGTWHIAATPEATQVVGQPRPTGRNVIRLRGANATGRTEVVIQYFTRYFGI